MGKSTTAKSEIRVKSFLPRTGPEGPSPDDPGNPTVNFHGERRRNDTHQSTTDPQARLYRKGSGREATLAYLGHVLLDNRHGLVTNVCVTAATGTAEREAAAWMLAASAPPGSTVGADKGYDTARFVDEVRALDVTPHIEDLLFVEQGQLLRQDDPSFPNVDGDELSIVAVDLVSVVVKVVSLMTGEVLPLDHQRGYGQSDASRRRQFAWTNEELDKRSCFVTREH